MTDYSRLIDTETWAFIERTNSFYPPDTIDFTISQQREIYDRMCRAFHAGYPAGVVTQTTDIHTPTHAIPIRIYRAARPDAAAVVIYFHGGGFVLGDLESHDDICAEISARTGYDVVSVDYRLSPEHLYPACHEDGYAAYQWAAERYRDRAIVLGGDSAGGTIAAAVAGRYRRHDHAPAGQVLIYPSLGGDRTEGSYIIHADAPMLTARDLDFYHVSRTGGADVAGDAGFSPLCDPDFSDLPPTVCIMAECDPLASDGPAYRDAIAAAAGKAISFEEKGLVHGYLRARHSVERARASFSRIVEAITALGRHEWPY